MTLPGWLLLVSALLALAVPLSIVATRVRLPLTAVLAVAGVVTAWGDAAEPGQTLNIDLWESYLEPA